MEAIDYLSSEIRSDLQSLKETVKCTSYLCDGMKAINLDTKELRKEVTVLTKITQPLRAANKKLQLRL